MFIRNKIASFFNALFVNPRRFKPVEKIERAVAGMNLTEKMVFAAVAAVAAVSGLLLLIQVHSLFLVEVPRLGGSFTEGMVGLPRFMNPVLAISETDKDLDSLIYSGLLKRSAEGGMEPDLAESYRVGDGGLSYDVTIRDGAFFHDGKKVTADDVLFTVEKALDPVVKSPQRAAWEGVEVQKKSENEIVFLLKKPYAPFLEALALGILPKHIWQGVSPEEFPFSKHNIDPVGAGPYKVEKITRNSNGIPSEVALSSWSKYAPGRPKIKNINFKFFQNESDLVKDYKSGSIDSASGLSPAAARQLAESGSKMAETSLPRVFAVFFNQNAAPVFLNKEVRQALDLSAPKQKIVDEVLLGFGSVLDGPTPADVQTSGTEGSTEAAAAMLSKAGWAANKDGVLEKKTKSGAVLLKFSISTSDTPELKKTAEILRAAWQQLGAQVEVKVFEAGDLSQNVIKSRKYESLLFGEVVGEKSDLYPFWHSSERNDPGLNISLYANIAADKALADLQSESDEAVRRAQKETVISEIKKDVPAVFLFSPHFIYAPAVRIKNISLKDIASPDERFDSIGKWYIETDKVLTLFANNEINQ